MKTIQALLPALGLATLLASATAQTPAPAGPAPPAPAAGPAQPVPPEPGLAQPVPAPPAPVQPAPAAGPADPAALAVTPSTNAPIGEGEKGLRLNFRGVPLDMVLSYLSDAAGFIVVLETEVRGKVDVWSNQPLTREEAIDLLNTVLNKNGCAAIRNGRTLKIVSRDDAKTKDIPVRSGADPEAIPKSDEMVTQIIPVHYANAPQLVQNLSPLLGSYAMLSANESGNALVLTGTQTDVRRMVEIVKALDTTISSVATIRVFPLRFADAKEVANAVKELFQTQTSQQSSRGGGQAFSQFFSGGGPGGPGGFGGDSGGRGNRGGGGGGRGGATAALARVVAVPDERSNSLIVSAPDDYMPAIENLVKEVDVSVADVTELRVFRLTNANPAEMAELLAELFPDETDSNSRNNSQGDFRFGGFGGFRGGNTRNTTQANTSERMKKKGRVAAVPDARTSSLIVTAASELMPQIGAMIEQLDASPAKKQKVFVYSLQNADVQQVEQIVRDMFDRSNSGSSRNSQSQNSALQNRSQQNQQNQGNTSGGFGNQGGPGGGGGQGQGFR